MEPRERIIKIQEYADMSGMALSEYCGLKEDDLKSIRTGKTRKVSEKVANAIVNKFHEINKLWILTGEGEMLLNQASPATHEENLNQKINELLSVIHTMVEINQKQQKQIDQLLQIIQHDKKMPYTSVMASEPNVNI